MDSSLIFGRNPVIAALQAHRSINKILIAKGTGGREIDTIVQLAREQKAVYQFVDRRQLDTMVQDTHQGVIAIGAEHAYAEPDELIAAAARHEAPPFLMVLDGIQDPQNLGSIIRSSDAMGVHGIVIPRRHAVGITPVVLKASAGAVEYVPVARVTNINQFLEVLKKQGYWCIGMEADGDEVFHTVDYKGPTALIVGSEGKGLRPLVRRSCDTVVRLPIGGHSGSLNVSVAAAIMMYEVYRQRQLIQKG